MSRAFDCFVVQEDFPSESYIQLISRFCSKWYIRADTIRVKVLAWFDKINFEGTHPQIISIFH